MPELDVVLLGNHNPNYRQQGILDGYLDKNLFHMRLTEPLLMTTHRIELVACPQPADVHLKAHMETRATQYQVNVCVCPEWWASSVTAVLLDSVSPTAQVTTSAPIILIKATFFDCVFI